MISEVQITCIILMGLITLFLAFALPRYIETGNVFYTARKILGIGTFLVMMHFIIQYIIHKQISNVEDIRTTVNLLFGIPISYTFNISYYYLQRQGQIKLREWSFTPILYLISIAIFIFAFMIDHRTGMNATVIYIMAILYTITIVYHCFLQVREHLCIVRLIKINKDTSYTSLIKWTKWSVLFMMAITLGFPIMTFSTNLPLRSFYGVLSISSAFFYILSFIGYGLIYNTKATYPLHMKKNDNEGQHSDENKKQLGEMKADRMMTIVDDFVKSEYYLQSGITIKDVAIKMGISCNMLKVWLHTTKYEKFSNWLVFLRIEKAKKFLIAYPDLNSDEIAEKCGFCDRQYFQRQFTKLEGISPSKWIKRQGANIKIPE